MNYSNYPILKILIPYVSGILITYFGNVFIHSPMILYLIIFCNLLISIILYRRLSFQRQWMAGLFIWGAALLLGMALTFPKINPKIPTEVIKNIANNRQFVAQVLEHPLEKKKSIKLIMQIREVLGEQTINRNAVIYVKKDSLSRQLKYGDVLLLNTQLSPISPPENPNSFDNQTYMRRKGILFTGYVPAHAWQWLQNGKVNYVKQYAYRIQQYFSKLFAESGLQGDEYAIITAILLGNDDTMEPELKAQYASAGVSHILCVSGMHVGIIFMIFNFLLRPMELYQKTRIVKALLLLLFIWAYACITGLAPSVQRAAAMFTFVTIGNLLNRNANIFHSLFASLFILLLFNPLLLFEIGFEMSYLAVFGIVILQKPIVSIFKPKHKIGNYFWELISVSVAAQLATFPLSIYYFGQFPNYFLLSNLSVISLSFVVVVTGVVLLATSWIGFVAHWVGLLLTYEIKLMNFLIKTIESLPFAVTDMISYSVIQVIICYMCIFFAYRYFTKRQLKIKYIMLTTIVLLLFSFGYDKWKSTQQSDVTVYSVDKMSVIGFNHHGSGILLADSAVNELCYDFNIKNHERKQKISSTIVPIDTPYYRSDGFTKIGNFIDYEGNTFYLLSGKEKIYAVGTPLKTDFLYLRHNPKISFRKLSEIVDFQYVIIDKSNSEYYTQKWLDSCRFYQIPCYSIRRNGYFSLKHHFSKN